MSDVLVVERADPLYGHCGCYDCESQDIIEIRVGSANNKWCTRLCDDHARVLIQDLQALLSK